MTSDSRWWWTLLAIVTGAVSASDGRALTATPARHAVVVVELFTSEGCSSCPPADIVLSQLARQPPTDIDVLAIGEHVDYWDQLGWRDRFSSAEFSARQSAYDANAFHRNEVYTPQIVVDGRFARVGTDVAAIRRDITNAAQVEKATVDVALVAGSGRVLHVDLHAQLPDADVQKNLVDVVVVATEDNLVTDVRAGENRGRTLRHDAVARSMRSVGTVRPGERKWETRADIPMAADWNPAHVQVIGFLQERKSRRIIGAGAARLVN